MIEQTRFELIKEKHGRYASWAIWADAGKKPKENMGDISIFDIKTNPGLFSQLKPEIIFIGLNCSRGFMEKPFANFHDERPVAMDFKVRFAFKGSPFWGGYMTDIIKNFSEKNSSNVIQYLKRNKSTEVENIRIFREEISDLGSQNPLLIAFGNAVYSILRKNLADEFTIVKIPHYSNFCSKEKYKEDAIRLLNSYIRTLPANLLSPYGLLFGAIFMIGLVIAAIMLDLKNPNVGVFSHLGGFLLGLLIPAMVGIVLVSEKVKQKVLFLLLLVSVFAWCAGFWLMP